MRAGVLDREVTLQSPTTPTNGDASTTVFTDYATVYAEKLSPSGVERFLGAGRVATATQGYRIRHRTDVEPDHRLVDGSDAWNITARFEGDGRRTETILLVERVEAA